MFSIIVALLVLIVGYLAWSIYSGYEKVKHLPGTWQVAFSPFRIPFIAPYIYFGTNHIAELIEKYGDKKSGLVRVSMAGRNIVVVSDKDQLKEMLVTKEKHFMKNPKSYSAFRTFGENILSILESEPWKPHHRICSPAFASNNLKFVTKVTVDTFDQLVEHRWKKLEDGNGSFVLPTDDYSDLTLQVLGKSIFGLDFGLFSNNPSENDLKFRKSMELMFTKGIIFKRFIADSPIFKYFYPFVMKYFGVDKAVECVSQKLDEIVQEKKELFEKNQLQSIDTESTDLISMMVETNSSMNEDKLSNTRSENGGLTRDEIKSNAFIFSLAGHETSSSLCQWASYELSKRPDVQQKAFDEIIRVVGDRDLTFEDYEKLNYVNGFIMECLRVHGPVSGILKTVKKEVELGGFKLPKNTSVLLSLHAASTSKNHWENPKDFIPERFPDAETQLKYQHSFTWLPFSIGNRKCIGYKFALIELCAIMTKLIRTYKLELLNDESVDPITKVTGVTIRPGNLKVRATRRV